MILDPSLMVTGPLCPTLVDCMGLGQHPGCKQIFEHKGDQNANFVTELN